MYTFIRYILGIYDVSGMRCWEIGVNKILICRRKYSLQQKRSRKVIQVVLVSYGCYNKFSQIWWLKMTEIYSFKTLDAKDKVSITGSPGLCSLQPPHLKTLKLITCVLFFLPYNIHRFQGLGYEYLWGVLFSLLYKLWDHKNF